MHRREESELKPGDMIQAGNSRFHYDVGSYTFANTPVEEEPNPDQSIAGKFMRHLRKG